MMMMMMMMMMMIDAAFHCSVKFELQLAGNAAVSSD